MNVGTFPGPDGKKEMQLVAPSIAKLCHAISRNLSGLPRPHHRYYALHYRTPEWVCYVAMSCCLLSTISRYYRSAFCSLSFSLSLAPCLAGDHPILLLNQQCTEVTPPSTAWTAELSSRTAKGLFNWEFLINLFISAIPSQKRSVGRLWP